MTMFKFCFFLLAIVMLTFFTSCQERSEFSYEVKNETNAPIDVLIVNNRTFRANQQTLPVHYVRRLPARSSEVFMVTPTYEPTGDNSEIYFEFTAALSDTFLILNANGDTLQKNHLDFANWRTEAIRNRKYYDHVYTFPILDSDF